MTLSERLTEVHVRAMRLYRRRQDVEAQIQQLQQQSRAIDIALVKTDGEIDLLETLLAAEQEASRGV